MGLHGKKDKSAPYHLAEAMQSGIKDSQMRTFPGGHLFFLLRQKQCIEAIVDFLDSSKFHLR
jgi:pimeloyl-ACP methyl ester carboxylesterase